MSVGDAIGLVATILGHVLIGGKRRFGRFENPRTAVDNPTNVSSSHNTNVPE
jgi:hypothetical protein